MAAETAWILLPEVGSAEVLKGGDDLVDGAAPGLMVSSKTIRLLLYNVYNIRNILITFYHTILYNIILSKSLLGIIQPPINKYTSNNILIKC